MGRKFISVLGTGNYKECTYFNDNEKVKTRFIQEALIEMYMKDINLEDEVIIFITPSARKKNWEDGYLIQYGFKNSLKGISEKKMKQVEDILGTEDVWEDKQIKVKGLQNTLKEKYPGVKITAVEINEGSTEEELWDTYDRILNVIEDDDNIIFDITHGFRSIPMQVLTVLNYAKVVKNNVNLLGIYYGAYEAKLKDKNEAPVFNLNIYNDILDWSFASKAFIKYGNSNEICDLYDEKVKEGHRELRKLEKFMDSLKAFTNNIATCRGRIITREEAKKYKTRMEKSIYEAAFQVQNNFIDIDKLEPKEINSIKPIENLFDKIRNSLSEFNGESNVDVGLATIKWCQRNSLVQNAYTAMDETIKTYVCSKYGLDDRTKKNRENICKAAMVNIGREKNNEDVKLKISEEKDIEIYELIKRTIPSDIIKLSTKVSTLRNDINHFGFLEKSSPYTKFKEELDELTQELFDIIDKYKDIDFRKL